MDKILPLLNASSNTASITASSKKNELDYPTRKPEKDEPKEATVKMARDRSLDSEDTAAPSDPNKDNGALVPPSPEKQPSEEDDSQQQRQTRWSRIFERAQSFLYPLALVFVLLVMTGWWITGLILHRDDLGWIVPFLVWLAISMRIFALHPPTRRRVGNTVRMVGLSISRWHAVGCKLAPTWLPRLNSRLLPAVTLIIILLGTFIPETSNENTACGRAISLLGLVVFLGIFYATSRDRSRINFQAVFGGTAAQFVLGLFVLKTKAGYDIFSFIGDLAKKLLGFSSVGTVFLTDSSVPALGWFFISVVPAVIFFVSFVQLLNYWGWIPWIVGHFSTVFSFLLGISGAEAVVAAASPFIGQGESAVLIRQYMSSLTKAEIHQIMTSGFATIAGSVMSAYMQMGISPVAIISSCVMSIPASIALSKLRYPETEEPLTRGRAPLGANAQNGDALLRLQEQAKMEAAEEDAEEKEQTFNALHAVGMGSWLGLKIAGMIVASVLCIMALLGLVDGLLGWWGSYVNVPQLSVQLIMGYLLYPVAFLLGVDRTNDGGSDLRKVAELLGIKVVANEFVAYGDLTTDPEYSTLSPRSRIIVMYALCGFGNFSAVGIQIGALAQLAPRRAGDVACVAFSALITGIVATLTSATIAGMLIDGNSL
ncbi:hypothetical protein SEPCBS57363_002514 [Sporothrix epigloea]|uniref:Concentrative nucleoside transporter, CNT family n=1 Tax=Sporothrix epigloea TaxID=1892477 RepID=A0ABP0DGB7_9PEZI